VYKLFLLLNLIC